LTILVDASALVAMATGEEDEDDLADEVLRHAQRFCSAVGLWEAVRAVARIRKVSIGHAAEAVDRLRADLRIELVPVGESEARVALLAHERYGKGTKHPARLNMGDCFAYACARTNNARLLYKGDDFSHTDLA